MSMENSEDNWKEELKQALYNYKKRNYKFGKYWTREQIREEFLRKKIFVLKGGIRIGTWIMMLIILVIPLISISILNSIYEIFNWIEFLLIFFSVWIIWFSLSSFLFLALIRFLVIGPSGIYYRNLRGKGFFSWNDLSKIEGGTMSSYPNLLKEDAYIKIYLSSGKKINFASRWYKNKEFSKKVYMEMFLNLLHIYYKLGKNPNI